MEEKESHSCFTCKYQNIFETSHEWLDCKCKIGDGKFHSIKMDCDEWESMEETK